MQRCRFGVFACDVIITLRAKQVVACHPPPSPYGWKACHSGQIVWITLWILEITNINLRKRAEMDQISELWKWEGGLDRIGHNLKKDANNNCRKALTLAPEERRKRGRPKETWMRTVERERMQLGFASWTETARAAEDRTTWKMRVQGLIIQEERRN